MSRREGVAGVPHKQGFPGVSGEVAASDGEVLQVSRVRRVVSRNLARTAGEGATELGLAFELSKVREPTQSEASRLEGWSPVAAFLLRYCFAA